MLVGINLLLVVMVVTCLCAENKIYIIKKESGLGSLKKRFLVYDESGTVLKYRAQSKIFISRNREVQVYPSKEVVGKLNHRWTRDMKAGFSVFDPKLNRWLDGNITQLNKIKKEHPILYSIHFDAQPLVMKNHIVANFANIYDTSANITLAEYARRPPFNLRKYEYVLTRYSDQFPDAFYILLFTTQKFLTIPSSCVSLETRGRWCKESYFD